MTEAAAREEILAFMSEREPRPAHVRHTTQLALELFDGLAALHGLGTRERLLLEAAAHLHDIGRVVPQPRPGHHEESARLIRERTWKNLSAPEVEVIAEVARYHRRTMPEVDHAGFSALSESDRTLVQRLAALLRLADAFDRSHAQLVRRVGVELRTNQIVFHLDASGPVPRELQSAQLKGDLARAVFQRDLVFMVAGEGTEPPA